METLINWLKNLLKTELIFPPIFEDTPVLGVFSKKLPYTFSFELLNFSDSFKFFFPKQIHSTKIVEVDELKISQSFFEIEGDAVLTFNKNLFLGIKTADCVPILITNKKGDFVGAVHGGWRGTVNKLLLKFLQKVINLGIKPEDILIAMGPHIKVCCYEVKDEVLKRLKRNFKNFENYIHFKNGKFFLDLEKLNLQQALELSIPLDNIWISKDCTYCLKDLYWSHRFHKENRKFQISLVGKLK